ncbi:hypothetical protein [Bifidobacterium longum]|uniref:hypothetical protein n=1 Tax=Bifidobacterium longum TaxID=216816 RepID=UPI000AEFCF49|nr:hypothetical protein [Bifidobacterium longum]
MRRFGKAMAALAVAACTLLGGVATANAADVTNKDNPITLSNVRVSDVGAQTANVSFDYRIDPAQVDEIKDVCFGVEVQRYHRHHPDREGALKCEYHRGCWIHIYHGLQHGRFR